MRRLIIQEICKTLKTFPTVLNLGKKMANCVEIFGQLYLLKDLNKKEQKYVEMIFY